MKIVDLLTKKEKDIVGAKPVTIGFLGDSVTQGCYELYLTSPTSWETVFDAKSAYSTRIKEILNILYPSVQINIINGGLSGDGTTGGLERIDRDVLNFKPDLVVVSFGLNDACVLGTKRENEYIENLSEIFDKIKESGAECIFLTQNYMCDHISPHIKDDYSLSMAEWYRDVQNEGRLKKYFDDAKKLCNEKGVKVCDMYSIWEKMNTSGVNTTELLANKLNHPTRDIHYYMAIKLIETMFEI